MKEEITIETTINTYYKDYMLYSLMERGIPSKYDGLSKSQRLVLSNAPDKLEGTSALIGECFKAGYHHGDMSLSGVINKMARIVGNSEPLLEGKGFFGNSVVSTAAAPRYTKCKINSWVSEMMKKYEPVNMMDEDGNPVYLGLDVPIGLCTTVVGIAPAYRSQILPRKLEDMQKYLNGGSTPLKPYFKGFKGIVEKSEKNSKSWVIGSKVEWDEKKRHLHIIDFPPMMRYDTFLEKLGIIIDESECNIRMTNNSKENVSITLQIGSCKGIEKLMKSIKSITSISWSEDIVFVDDDGVVKYDNIKDYLDDFKIFRNRNQLKLMEYHLGVEEFESRFMSAKIEFLKFMIEGKKSESQVLDHFSKSKWIDGDQRMINRLKSVVAWKITPEGVKECEDILKEMINKIKTMKSDISSFKKNNEFELKSKAVSLVSI